MILKQHIFSQINSEFFFTEDDAKFCISYWYGHVIAEEIRFLFSKDVDTCAEYFESYKNFIDCLYVAGINKSSIEDFLIDYTSKIKDTLLLPQISQINNDVADFNIQGLIPLVFYHQDSELFPELLKNLMESIESITESGITEDIDDFIVLLANHFNNSNRIRIYESDLVNFLLEKDYPNYLKVLDSSYATISRNLNKITSDNFLDRCVGFHYAMNPIEVKGYKNLYEYIHKHDSADLQS